MRKRRRRSKRGRLSSGPYSDSLKRRGVFPQLPSGLLMWTLMMEEGKEKEKEEEKRERKNEKEKKRCERGETD